MLDYEFAKGCADDHVGFMSDDRVSGVMQKLRKKTMIVL